MTGPLSSVVGLSYSFINSSTVNITWSPPFTLPGTNIIGYNISNNLNSVQTFTMETYHVLLLTDITNSSSEQISITVAGYNGLDGGIDGTLEIYLPAGDHNCNIFFVAKLSLQWLIIIIIILIMM